MRVIVLVLYSTPIESGWVYAEAAALAALLEALVTIQDRLQVPLAFPARDISSDEQERILVVAEVLRTGSLAYPAEPWSVAMPADAVVQVIALMGDGAPQAVTLGRDEAADILGVHVDLGQAIMECSGMCLSPVDRDALTAALREGDRQRAYNVRFTPAPGSTVEVRYPKWLPYAELAFPDEASHSP